MTALYRKVCYADVMYGNKSIRGAGTTCEVGMTDVFSAV
jgi:hypothetical protein